MGITTDAILTYGVNLFDEASYYIPILEDSEDYLDWWYENDIEDEGAELITHCSYNYPMYILSVPNTTIYTSRGDTTKLILKEPNSVDLFKFDQFCNKYVQNLSDKPTWLNAVIYG